MEVRKHEERHEEPNQPVVGKQRLYVVGTALAVAGSALAMRGAYGEGTHAMLAGMIRLDKEKSLEIIDKVRDEKDSID